LAGFLKLALNSSIDGDVSSLEISFCDELHPRKKEIKTKIYRFLMVILLEFN
jgi:hypothetical protein